jgi:molybdopterin/thiamine biosynthesis adenylyltransferase/rhodanese-related sulfurtransferase
MMERYSCQIALPEVGLLGQSRIAAASILVVGAGGLGCAVLQYLAAAGVGCLVVVDHDKVEETNLHRQPLYRMSDLGHYKAEVAQAVLRDFNPEVRIDAVCQRLTAGNAVALVSEADIVIDAADSFAVTYILSDECHRAGKPLVSASVLGLSGYVGVFCAGAPSYRAVFPEVPWRVGSCASAGVLGTAVGVMGTLQAHLALSLVLGLEPSPLGQLVSVDLRKLHFSGFSFGSAREPQGPVISFIAPSDVAAADLVVDLRSRTEAPVTPFPASLRLSVEEIEQLPGGTPSSQRVVLCCRSGLRAWHAATKLQTKGFTNLALLALGD